MRLFCTITVLLTAACLPSTISQRQALFVKKDVVENVRQGTLREYLPPANTQKPRPFQPSVTQGSFPSFSFGGSDNNVINGGYPAAGSITPQPPFSIGSEIRPPVQIPSFNGYSPPSKPQPSFPPTTGGYPSSSPIGPSGPTSYPSSGFPSSTGTAGFPSSSGPTGFPSATGPTGFPSTGPSSTGPTGFPSRNGYPSGPSTAYPASSSTFPTPSPGQPTGFPSRSSASSSPSTDSPSSSTSYPSSSTGFPSSSTDSGTDFPTSSTEYPSSSTGFPTPSTSFSRPSTSFPVSSTGFSFSSSSSPTTTITTDSPSSDTDRPSPTTNSPTPSPEIGTDQPSSSTGFPTSSPRPFPTISIGSSTTTPAPSATVTETLPPFTSHTSPSSEATSTTPSPGENELIPTQEVRFGIPDEDRSGTETEHTTAVVPPDDENHPPHIHDIDVECSKEMMTINIEFNRQFDGIIYSKGHYNSPECRYVKENSGRARYSFTVNLNDCGTEFINAFDTQGKSYLENVLVMQNEPGIQEVWDTVRSVRCLWEGNLKKALNVALSVGMLNQEIVTFSGDTAMARLDIQLGRGPFAPPANGLVKIGEVMTLVVSVTGDAGFDIQVKDCRAKDSNGDNVVDLTDDNGCVLKPKLFGAFQKTRNTGNTGASIIAYAFFNAFKFPDVMDLVLECNVDLCKTDCEMCPDPNQKTEPGRRRRRDLYIQNSTDDSSVTIGKMLRVILPEDLSDGKTMITLTQNDGICVSAQGFMLSSALMISLLMSSCLFNAYMWLKYQRLSFKK